MLFWVDAAAKEAETTTQCGSSDDEETERAGAKRVRRGWLLLLLFSIYYCFDCCASVQVSKACGANYLFVQSLILKRFGVNYGSSSRRVAQRRNPEDRVLKSSEGHFRNGVLDVKHLLKPSTSAVPDEKQFAPHNKGGKKNNGKKNKGKKKGGGRKRH